MKTNKKLTMIIGISVMLAALIVGVSMFLIIDNYVADTVISVEDRTALAGDSISIPINIDRNHGMYVGQIALKYDAAALEFISIANGGVFDACVAEGMEHPGMVYIIVNQSGLENTTKDGTIATINFKVKESAAKGEHPVILYQPEKIEDGTYFMRVQDVPTDNTQVTNQNNAQENNSEKWIVPKCENSIVTVK